MSSMRTFFLNRATAGFYRAAVYFIAVGFLAGCGGGDGTTDPPGETPSFSISLSGSALSITQGANGNVTVTVTRSGGFTGAVAVAVEGLPSGVTASALTIASGSTSGNLQLTASAGATTGGAQLTVRGTGTGVDPKTAALALTVNASTPNPTPDFTLSLNPTSGLAPQASTAQTQVNIARTGGFNGAVTLSASGLPNGVSVSFNPAAPTGATSNVVFTVTGAAVVGTYPITIQGVGAGVPNRSASYSLQVTSGGPPVGGNTSFRFCQVSGLPIWVAVKNGNGAWTRILGTDGVYSFQIDGVGGVAWVYPTDAGFQLNVSYMTQAELHSMGSERCISAGNGKLVSASVPGLGLTDIAVVSLGGSLASPTPNSFAPATNFNAVPNGPVDLIAGRSLLDQLSFTITPQRYLIQRGLNPAAGSNIGAIDFAGPNGFDPVANNLTLTNVTGSFVVTTTSLRTSGGSIGNLAAGFGAGTWYGVPGARLQAGDLHIFSATSSEQVPLAPSQTTVRFIANPGPLTMALGPALTAPTVNLYANPGNPLPRATYVAQGEYNRYWLANFQNTNPSPLRGATVEMTAGYRGSGTGTVTLEIPDFSGVSGWLTTWGLQNAQPITWTVTGIGWTGGGVNQPLWLDGNTYMTASRMGQFATIAAPGE